MQYDTAYALPTELPQTGDVSSDDAALPEHIDALDRQLAKLLFHRQTVGAPILLRR